MILFRILDFEFGMVVALVRTWFQLSLLLGGLSWSLALPGGLWAEDHFMASLRVQSPSKSLLAPDFTLRDLGDRKVSLRDFQGKLVFLNFWATWCPPCRYEMPSMERLYKEFKDKGLVVLAINLKEGREKVKSFMVSERLTFPALLDSSGEVAQRYGVRGIPTTFLVNGKGEIVGKALGARDWSSRDARGLIRRLLGLK